MYPITDTRPDRLQASTSLRKPSPKTFLYACACGCLPNLLQAWKRGFRYKYLYFYATVRGLSNEQYKHKNYCDLNFLNNSFVFSFRFFNSLLIFYIVRSKVVCSTLIKDILLYDQHDYFICRCVIYLSIMCVFIYILFSRHMRTVHCNFNRLFDSIVVYSNCCSNFH